MDTDELMMAVHAGLWEADKETLGRATTLVTFPFWDLTAFTHAVSLEGAVPIEMADEVRAQAVAFLKAANLAVRRGEQVRDRMESMITEALGDDEARQYDAGF